MSIKIDKGIRLPPARLAGISAALKSMEVGDSFTFPENKRRTVSSTIGIVQRKTLRRFITRKESPGVIRCWRVE